jgi:hypothetical protein
MRIWIRIKQLKLMRIRIRIRIPGQKFRILPHPNPQHWLQKVKSLIVPFFAQLPVLRAQTTITLAAGFGCAVDAVELRAQSSSLGFTRAEII